MEIKPKCRLVGTNGNAFAIIANVSRALKNAGQVEKAKEWQQKAMSCGSYDDLLALVWTYVEPY
jgi:hypothetical protein